MSFQTLLTNHTPFQAEKFVLPDREGQEVILVVVSATFEQAAGAAGLSLAAQQAPLEAADVHHGPPEFSSVCRESDIALVKPLVDVLVHGFAQAPGGRPVTSLPVELRLGDIHKTLLVTGDRHWRRGSLGSASTSPRPFEAMPLVFDRAFGGIDRRHENPRKHGAEPRNLSGLGFRGVRSYDPAIDTDLPNIEYPNDRQSTDTDRPCPGGFGVVARSWQPRIGWAGTYDDAWRASRWPLLPQDFDTRHYQCAPTDQQSAVLRGGETVQLRHLTPDGLWRFRLPVLDIPLRTLHDDGMDERSLRMDTVIIDAQHRRVSMLSRACWRTRRNRRPLREIVIGHTTPAWMRANHSRKRFVDLSGSGGASRSRPHFRL